MDKCFFGHGARNGWFLIQNNDRLRLAKIPENLLARMKELMDSVTRKQLTGDWRSITTNPIAQNRLLIERTRTDTETLLHTRYSKGMLLDEMEYVDADDVRTWASFLVETIPHVAIALVEHDKSQFVKSD